MSFARSDRTRLAGRVEAQSGDELHRALAAAMTGLRGLGQEDNAHRLATLGLGYDEQALRIVVFGEFSRGKSTLINALLGRVVLPTRAVPTTGHVTRVVFDRGDEVRVRLRNGQVETCPLDLLGSFAVLDFNRRAREDVEEIEVAVDCPMLRAGTILIDTPGVCDDPAQTARASRRSPWAIWSCSS